MTEKNRRDAISGAFLIVMALAYYLAIATSPRPSMSSRGRAVDIIGDMGFPTALALILGAGGLMILLGAVVNSRKSAPSGAAGTAARPASPEGEGTAADRPDRTYKLLGCIVAFVLLLPVFGYLVMMPLFVLSALAACGYERRGKALAFAVGFTVLTYVGFTHGLGVVLPRGSLF